MALKTVVKVGNISNLSDARYCAGMGVDFLGFRVHPSDENYVDPKTYQEFRGWFSGPKVVIEIYGIASESDLTEIVQHYAPDYVESGMQELELVRGISLPLILSSTPSEYGKHKKMIDSLQTRIEYVRLPSSATLDEINLIAKSYKVLVDVDGITTDFIQSLNPDHGISLSGSLEEKPGFKSYDGIAEVLELLEVDE